MKLLFLSTSVGPFGSGIGGGVELTIESVAVELLRRGHMLQIVAPSGSVADHIPLVTIPGALHSFAQDEERELPVSFPANSVVAQMWEYAFAVQEHYDLLVNFAYDWLPFYLTPLFTKPIAHFVSMGSLLDAMDQMILQTNRRFPGTIGMYTHTQAHTFFQGDPFPVRILSSGIDLDRYSFVAEPESSYAWIARIAPEKGLEDAAAVSAKLGITIDIFGKMQDKSYWQSCLDSYPEAKLNYRGFHPTTELQAMLGKYQALLMTPKWIEAFGNIAIEALACGVPVISYARGGPVEIIRHNETGFLVEPDQIDALAEAIEKVPALKRQSCRRQAEREYSLEALGDRFLAWFKEILR